VEHMVSMYLNDNVRYHHDLSRNGATFRILLHKEYQCTIIPDLKFDVFVHTLESKHSELIP